MDIHAVKSRKSLIKLRYIIISDSGKNVVLRPVKKGGLLTKKYRTDTKCSVYTAGHQLSLKRQVDPTMPNTKRGIVSEKTQRHMRNSPIFCSTFNLLQLQRQKAELVNMLNGLKRKRNFNICLGGTQFQQNAVFWDLQTSLS